MATEMKLLMVLLLIATSVSALTSSEEMRLILQSDSSVIDEKISELPGGVLLPPEPRHLPVPTMEPGLPTIDFDKVNFDKSEKNFEKGKVSQVRVMPSVDRIKSVMRSMKDRLTTPHRRTYPTHQSVQKLTHRSSPHFPTMTPPISALEMSMKRIEILASRAGFNMSSIPRRSQLQIVTKLADKLPLKLSETVKSALRSNDLKIYEYLPEPSRDPLIEDNPEFLSQFLDVKEDDFFDPNDFPMDRHTDHSKVSLTTDGEPPVAFDDNDFDNSDLAFMTVPKETNDKNRPQFLPKPLPLTQESEKITKLEQKLEKLEQKLEKEQEKKYDLETSPSNTHDVVITRDSKSFSSSERHPIRVSIISKESIVSTTTQPTTIATTTTTIATTTPKTQTKYVEVQPLTSLTSTSITNPKKQLLFQVEKETSNETPDYDLSEDEITAMVAELRKYEEFNNDNSVEDLEKIKSTAKPHPLEFPDHPDHPISDEYIEELIRNNTHDNQWVPVKQQHHNHPHPHGPPHSAPHPHHHPHPHSPHHPHTHLPPPPHLRPMMRPYGPPRPPPPPRPLRINDVKVSEMPKNFNKECDYFSNEICLLVQDYPIEAISESIERNPELALSLLPREEEEEKPQIEPSNKLSSEGGFLCPSKVAYGKIKKAKSNTNGKWKFVVNYGDKTQTLRIEKCLTPGDKCSYVMPHYRTACTQVYNYHRLLAWDSENGLHIDVFKVPTCCTCHVQGYYSKTNPNPQTPAAVTRRRMMIPQPSPPIMFHHQPPRFGRTQAQAQSHKPSSASSDNDDDLQELLKQYSSLKDKIANKKKATTQTTQSQTRSDRMLQKLNLIETVLMRKKRKNSMATVTKSKSPKTNLKSLIKTLSKNKNLNKKTILAVAKKHLSTKKHLATKTKTHRNGRNLKKQKKDSKSSKRRTLAMLLTRALKNKNSKNNKNLIPLSRRLKQDKVNYSYHPIMDYYARKL